MTEKGQLLIVSGPPGAGKSTVAQLLAQQFMPSALAPGDTFFAFLRIGAIPPWTPEAHRQNAVVIRAAAAASGRMVNGGITVVYDGVVGPWLLPEFMISSDVKRVHYAILLPSEAECLHRVVTRTGHGFNDLDAARHMYRDFADASVDVRHVFPARETPAVVADAILHALTLGHLAIPEADDL